MKTVHLFTLFGLVLSLLQGYAEPTAANKSEVQIKIELRDGSRIVGKNLSDSLSFHSDALGDAKLPWSRISSIEFTADSETASLKTIDADQFNIQPSPGSIHVQTAFGPLEIAGKLIRRLDVVPEANQDSAGSSVGGRSYSRLTIELRDGSHVVGKSLNDVMIFHSSAMGDLKLSWSGIRSIEFTAGKTDSARLTAINGDVYEVQFSANTVHVETSFGGSELPVKLIASIQVSKVSEAGEDPIGWWKLDEGSGTVAKDCSTSVPTHDGGLINGPTWVQTSGSNWSLQFNGANQYVSLGDIFQGAYKEISIACWIKRSGPGAQDIVDRGSWDNPGAIALTVNNFAEFGHYPTQVYSKTPITAGQWHHLVGTMAQSENQDGYIYSIYVDGKLENTLPSGLGLTAGSFGWTIGARDGGSWGFQGLIEDVRIYDHALSDAEVQAVYAEQQHGDPGLSAFSRSSQRGGNTFAGRFTKTSVNDAGG